MADLSCDLSAWGPEKKFYYEHIRRISDLHKGVVLLIDADDLDIIVRRTLAGKRIEAHLQDLFDRTVREIS